jgi:hypothetical protein
MTRFNSLFGYLESLHSEASEAGAPNQAKAVRLSVNGKNHKLWRDIDKEQQPYYRIDLEKSHFSLEINGVSFSLSEHHISINNQQFACFAKSAYHYTGYFKVTRGQKYVLHVYFSDDDAVNEVKLALKDQSAAGTQPTLTEAQQQAVIELATEKAQPIMMTVRAELTKKITALKEAYQAAEIKATAEHAKFTNSKTKNSYRRYEGALSDMIKALTQLVPLLDPTRTPYHGILQFTSAWHAAIQTIRPQAITSPSEQAAETTEETSAPPSIDTATPAAATSTSSTSIAIRKLTAPIALDQEIEKLAAAYQAFASQVESDEIAKQQLDSLLSEIGSIAILLDEKNYTASAKAIKQLYDLRKAIYEQGEKLMVRLLLDPAHVQLAEGWSPFHYVLEGTELLVKAFHATDSKSLSCLLEYGDYEQLEQLSLNINSQAYSSLLHYFLALGKEKQKERLSHVTTLLQHRPGMLLVKDKKTGLPLAHNILRLPEHPLQQAIETLEKHQLVKLYRILIKLPQIAEEDRIKYKHKLDICQNRSDVSVAVYDPFLVRQALALMVAIPVTDDTRQVLVNRISNEPEAREISRLISIITKEIDREINNLNNKALQKRQRETIRILCDAAHSAPQLEKRVSTASDNPTATDVDETTYDKLKKILLKHAQEKIQCLRYLQIIIETDVKRQTALQTPRSMAQIQRLEMADVEARRGVEEYIGKLSERAALAHLNSQLQKEIEGEAKQAAQQVQAGKGDQPIVVPINIRGQTIFCTPKGSPFSQAEIDKATAQLKEEMKKNKDAPLASLTEQRPGANM